MPSNWGRKVWKMKKRTYRLGFLLALLLMASPWLGGCRLTSPRATPEVPVTPVALANINLGFADYEEPAIKAAPAIRHEPISPDLSNVVVGLDLSPAQQEGLARNGFVVSPGAEKEFFTLYQATRDAEVPVFVTSDSLLHAYHLLFDKVLRTAEKQHFIVVLRDLNRALLARTDEQYQALRSSDWADAARRTVAFVGVASKLLDPGVTVPDYAAGLVEEQLSLIEAASGIGHSPIFPGLEPGEDYSQYIPRGHYTGSEELAAYFKAMIWYGRMTFRLKTQDPTVGKDETRCAILLVQALRTACVADRSALEAWADLYQPTVFFVGRSDDLSVVQYAQVIDQVYGPVVTTVSLADEGQLEVFIAEAYKLPPPRILGIVLEQPSGIEEQTKGLRFMGQRFVPDSYMFGQFLYPNVGTDLHRRGLPKGLDLLAAMDSERAYQILEGTGETAYENYPRQMDKVRAWVSGLGVEEWTETLYNAWLYSFQPLLEVAGEGHPAFMRSPAWVDKQLNTALGNWAELKRDTILYAKQFYPRPSGGPMSSPLLPKGYVEPVPGFYARLAALCAMARTGLSSRGLLDEQDNTSLGRLEDLSLALQAMAEKELRGQPLTEDEYTRLRGYGDEMRELTMAAADVEGPPGDWTFSEQEPEAAVIADVATDPVDMIVLEEAVGRVDEIYVVVPVVEQDGTTWLQVAKGGVFSYYEFPWPAGDRLTDEKWRAMLNAGQAPPRPEWSRSFLEREGRE